MNRIILRYITLLAWLVGLSFALTAQNPHDKTYRIGLYENRPLCFRDTDGGLKGIYIDLLEHVALEKSWILKYVYEPSLEKSLENLKKGDIDILVALGYSEERAKEFDFTKETVMTNWGEIYIHKDSAIRSILNLEGKKVAVMKNNIYYEGSHGLKNTAHQFKINIKFVEVPSFKEVLEQIDQEKVDAGLISVLYGDMHKNEYEVVGTPIVFHPIELRFALHKGGKENSAIIQALDSELKKLIKDENSVYYQSQNRWLNRTTSTVNYRWLLFGLGSVGGVALLFLVLNFFLRKQVQRRTQELVVKNREIQELNEGLEQKVKDRTTEVMRQKEEIELQKRELEVINKQMRDSITYARNIQEAILPEEAKITQYLPDSFVLSLPRDIVSGDFHWFAHNPRNNWNMLAVADCTGHGVPGAFMSMLGKSSLDYIIYEKKIDAPHEILHELQVSIYRALGTNAKDGMDIALCGFDSASDKVHFAGALASLFLVRGSDVYVVKGDKFPIGGSVKYFSDVRHYQPHIIEVMPDDCIYMTSDGYLDQFGGDDNKRFSSQRFRTLISEITLLPMSEQLGVLKYAHFEWRGTHKQLDDVCVVGVRISK
jgi:ABC-type amino acid transport substrate-binding protein/serine phosphatase RsbU (regulator of sigma subunit)